MPYEIDYYEYNDWYNSFFNELTSNQIEEMYQQYLYEEKKKPER